MIAFVGTLGVLSVTALGMATEPVVAGVVVPSEEELETLQQTASAIETITALRDMATAPNEQPVVAASAALATLLDVSDIAEMPEVVARQATPELSVEPVLPDAAATCIEDLGALLTGKNIPFGSSSSEIDPQYHDAIREIAVLAESCGDIRIMIEGHSDATGLTFDNNQLSWNRAEAVIALIAEMGFETSVYEPIGFGARFATPVADGVPASEDSRRVSFRLIQELQPTPVSQ